MSSFCHQGEGDDAKRVLKLFRYCAEIPSSSTSMLKKNTTNLVGVQLSHFILPSCGTFEYGVRLIINLT